MSTKHWGEIESEPADDSTIPDVSTYVEKAMDNCSLDNKHGKEINIENIVLPPPDPLVMHAISLNKYMNEMTELISGAELASEINLLTPENPPIPMMPDIELKHKKNILNYIPKELTDFYLGKEVSVPEIKEPILKKILERCVAIMFAQIGFETTHQSVLDVLTDVLEAFLQKVSCKYVEVLEEEEIGAQGFSHTIERVFAELGVGSIKDLHDYYQRRVIKYVHVLQDHCKELEEHYSKLYSSQNQAVSSEFEELYKTEIKTEDADGNTAEVFSTVDGEGLNLESYYQLLNSVEAEACLQNSINEDE